MRKTQQEKIIKNYKTTAQKEKKDNFYLLHMVLKNKTNKMCARVCVCVCAKEWEKKIAKRREKEKEEKEQNEEMKERELLSK